LTDKALKQALKIPHVEPGMTIGLFGGSFNPPHEGHVLVSELALTRINLNKIWWLVSPGNPLKDHSQLQSLEARLTLCKELIRNPHIEVTAFEAKYHTRFTADTLSLLKRKRPRVNFVWIMGADNLANFHKWQNWRKIADMMPIVVVDRPGSTLSFSSAKAARALAKYRLDPEDSALIGRFKPPVWTFKIGRASCRERV